MTSSIDGGYVRYISPHIIIIIIINDTTFSGYDTYRDTWSRYDTYVSRYVWWILKLKKIMLKYCGFMTSDWRPPNKVIDKIGRPPM